MGSKVGFSSGSCLVILAIIHVLFDGLECLLMFGPIDFASQGDLSDIADYWDVATWFELNLIKEVLLAPALA